MPRRDHARTLAVSLILCSFTFLTSASAQETAQGPTSQDGTPTLKPFVKMTPAASSTKPAVSGTSSTTPPPSNAEIDAAVRSIMADGGPDLTRLRIDKKAAKRMARYHWLDRAALANPRIIEAITYHKKATEILARHPRLGAIGDADHYVCRRVTQYKKAARLLAASPQAHDVITLDPEGIYTAIERDKKIIRILSKNPMFDQMIVDNPDLGRVISKFM